MESDLRSWGFGLVGIGIISILFLGFLDPVWGGILIALGVLCFLIQRRGMYIAIGTGLMLAGIMNIFGGEFGGWTIFGVFQIGIGIYEISKFWKYASVSGGRKQQLKEDKAQTQKRTEILEFIDKHPNCTLSDIDHQLPTEVTINQLRLSDMLKSMEEDSLIEARGKFGTFSVNEKNQLNITLAGKQFLMSQRGQQTGSQDERQQGLFLW